MEKLQCKIFKMIFEMYFRERSSREVFTAGKGSNLPETLQRIEALLG